ncbi:WhiB family transcriptional regulator [Actinomycetospora termitidis]|uniref:WhiB family transcriptional regulator n=1 Tax=Actinomycetospora termitidis TaxID=3053470 RepID=UPI003CE550A3
MSTQPAPSSLDDTTSLDDATSSPKVTAAGGAADAREVLVPGELYAALAVAAGETPAWHRDALCAQADPEAFFPEKGGSPAEAKQVCRRCPVREQCLTDAIAHDERFGVWGGVGTRKQRQTLAPTLAPAPEPESVPESELVTLEQSRERGSGASRRESTPVPRGRAAVDGMAARLPTEPRPARVMRQGPRSTFPDRARRTPATGATSSASTTTAKAGRRAVSTTAAAANPDHLVPSPRAASPARRRDEVAAVTATVTALRPGRPAVGSAAVAGPGEEAADDLAAPAPAPSARPPDPVASAGPPDPPSGELAATIAAVLTAQRRTAGDPAEVDVDPGRVLALATGERDTPTIEAELRVAAVALVESGRATRGQTARRFGLRSQDVAHWVACHQQGIPSRVTSIRGPR